VQQERLESTATAAEQLAKVTAAEMNIFVLQDSQNHQGKSGLESVLQDDDDCTEDKENRTFQRMVVRAVKK